MLKKRVLLFLLALFTSWNALLATPPGWIFLYEKEGFKAYESTGSPLAYRAEGIVDVDILELAAVLVDVPRRREWVTRLAESRLIEGEATHRQVVYARYDLPWPTQDRDVIVESLAQVDELKGKVQVHFRNVEHPSLPPIPGCIRVPMTEGGFTLEDLGNHRVFVSYTVSLDPGGWLPTWLVKLFVRDAPADTLRRFKTQVLKTRGQYESFIAPYRARREQQPRDKSSPRP